MNDTERFIRRKNVVDRIVALAVGLAAFAVYATTMARGVFPGPAADFLTAFSGLEPRITPMHPLWGWFVRGLAGAGDAGLVMRVHLFSALSGALGVALLYRCVSWLVFTAIDWDDRSYNRARQASVLAGLGAALALAFATTWWMVSTRCYHQAFDILLLALSARLLMRFHDTGRKGYAMAFAFLYGIGLTEATAFWPMAPVFLAFLLLSLWQQRRLRPRIFITMLVAGLLGSCLYLAAAADFYGSEGFRLAAYGGFPQIVRIMLRTHMSTVRSGLPRVGWMIIVFLTVAPWLTALVVGRRALNDERDWSYYVLHVVMTGIALSLLANVRIAPWPMLGLRLMPVMPYVLIAMVTGYLVAYWYLFAADWWPAPSYGTVRYAISRWLGLALAIPLLGALIVFGVRNAAEADGRSAALITNYADEVLDSLEGREWLVSDGALDAALIVRSHERGIPLRLLNLSRFRDRTYIRRMQGWFDNQRLRNTAELGVMPLVQDWLRIDPDIENKVAILSAPDLWAGVEELTVVPHRTLFLATRKPAGLDAAALHQAHLAFWEKIMPALEATDDASPVIASYRRHLRRHTAFVANNFGVLMQDLDNDDVAFDAYLKARLIDPRNVSAMLNQVVMVNRGYRPELRDQVEAEAEELFEGITDQPHIWSLSRYFGYVRDPMAFARLGWTWALSGQPGIAVAGLRRAADMLPEEQRTGVRETLADVYLLKDEDERGEALYWELLVENPDNLRALLTLARVATRRGDFNQARELLERAERTDAPRPRLAMEWASFHLAAGDVDRARLMLEELVEVEPGELRAWPMLSAVLVQQNELSRLEEVVNQMTRMAGPEEYLVLVSRAQLAFRKQEWERAREFFLRAVRQRPNVPLVREWVLRMDFMLGDRDAGERHAQELLRIDRDNALANYIVGSLMLERGRLDAAEDHLRTSITSRRTAPALNDLAFLLQQMGLLDEAEEYARAAFQLDDRLYHAWDTLGVILMRRGNYEEAEEALDNALSMHQDDMRIFLHMAQLQALKGNLGRAREIVRMLEERRFELPPKEQRDLSELSQELINRADRG